MSGHTFKVGDRVHLNDSAYPWTILSIDDDCAWIKNDNGVRIMFDLRSLSALPPFEPVERWVCLHSDGELNGYFYVERPIAPLVGGAQWVKVVISPAEDQS